MINPATALMLARYKAWADELFFAGVAALPPGEVVKERPGIFKNMIGTLNHNLLVDLIWQAHLEHRDHGFKSRNEVLHPLLTDLWNAQRSMDEWFVAWSERQTDDSLAESIAFTFVSGDPGVMTAGEMFLHLVIHSGYHRGWVVQMFFEAGIRPPITDLPVYLCGGATPC
ncbi:DinB family protein [Pseudomonas sp. NA-150]|uniref:DinB family protein n=1 Tax=Pseudomonas sp. NA-150 TaxID=3367525 RepID=UPI0037C57E5F